MACDGGFFPCADSVTGSIVLIALYFIVLLYGSRLLADGSEMLLDLLDPGFVGGFLLPVLGALPDATIVLVSSLGSLEEAQAQLSVGMGTLAGSTIMLLTLPWFSSLFVARCNIENDVAVDRKCDPFTRESWNKQGVSVDESVPKTAIIMLVTAFSYVIVQGPAFAWATQQLPDARLRVIERYFAMAGFIVSFLMFLGYSIYMVRNTKEQAKKKRLAHEEAVLRSVLEHLQKRIQRSAMSPEQVAQSAAKTALSQWRSFAVKRASSRQLTGGEASPAAAPSTPVSAALSTNRVESDGSGSDSDDEPPQGPKWKIALKAAALLAIGALLIAAFSDPMVDSISTFSAVTGLPSFYVSFVITPFASNASELISSLMFAAKKKTANSSVTFGQLYGAATMNNTLCLGVFCLMVFIRGLQWSFSAEVTAILLVQCVVGVLAMRRTMRLKLAIPSMVLYPAAIGLVALLEAPFIDWK